MPQQQNLSFIPCHKSKLVQANTLKAMAAAVSNQAYAVVPQEKRDQLRASVFKNMLITQL